MSRLGNRQAGFSLFEMLVVLVLVFSTLLIAASLFQEAGRILKAAEGELFKPPTGVVTDRLRQDVQSAAGLLLAARGWTSDPLLLSSTDGLVTYAQDATQLVRTVFGMDGEVDDEEAWIQTLVSWRWQVTGSNLIEVEIVYLAPADFERWRLDDAPTRPEPEWVRENLLLALRGQGRAGGW